MSMDKFFELLKHLPISDKIVRIRYKWFAGDAWTYDNEFLCYNGNADCYEWENDWDEGQEYVEVVGFLALDQVHIPDCFL